MSRVLLASLALLLLTPPTLSDAADKKEKQRERPKEQPRKAEPPRKAERQSKDAGKQATRTQRQAADAFAADLGGRTGKAETPESETDKQLKSLDRELRDEESRHRDALAKLRKEEQKASKSKDVKRLESVRTSVAREDETYKANRARIEERRRQVIGGKAAPDAPVKDPFAKND